MLSMGGNPMERLKIERWKWGWQIIAGPDPVEISCGLFLTFQEAYDTMSKIKLVEEFKNGNEHRKRITKKCTRTSRTTELISQEN